jgi:carboxymethylenebutenolidase
MGEQIELESSDGHRFDAWLARPAGKPRGGIVVVQEIFGVNAHIRRVTEGFASEGWLAIAPAIMDRVEKKVELAYDDAGVARGRELVARVGFDNALRDVAAAAAHAAQAGKVGVVGFCWGGTVALLSNTRMKLPAVSYYGGRSIPFLHERSGAPLLMHFGRRDPIIPPEHVAKLRAAFPRAEVHEYEAGHGFNCDERADFDAGAARIARGRTLAFLEQHLA